MIEAGPGLDAEEANRILDEVQASGRQAAVETYTDGTYAIRVQEDGWRCPYCWLLTGEKPADHLRRAHGLNA
jgi:hypothetical protein